MSAERHQVAVTAAIQLSLARNALEAASKNVAALKYGVEPTDKALKQALASADVAIACLQSLIKRIPTCATCEES